MTISQLRIVLLTARHGSISAAAEELGIPQPNASSGIKALEKDLGFDIFIRAHSGIRLTDKGQLFLEHAQRIVDEDERIKKLCNIGNVYQMRVGCTNYYRGREAFVKLCAQYKDAENADLQYYNVSFDKGIRLLAEHKLDVVVGLTIDSLLPTIVEMAEAKKLTCLELGDTHGAVTLSRNHPIVKEALFAKGIDMETLSRYPYVAYHSLNADFDAPYYKAAFPIPCKYNIYIEERETRFKIVRDTDAFMMGGAQPQEILDRYDLVEYELPGYVGKVVCLYRDIDEDRNEVKGFIKLI